MHYPRHVGFIPDGNRTRAKNNGVAESVGYIRGMQVGIEMVRYMMHHTDIQAMTGRFLSTENVRERSEQSLDAIFSLVYQMLGSLDADLEQTKTDFVWIGSTQGLPTQLVTYLEEKQQKFSFGKKRIVCFAINYGGRDEIVRAIHRAAKDNVSFETIDEQTLNNYMDMAALPPLDLVIRTKGDSASRTSGFASRNIGYAELFFSSHLCPDFTVDHFQEIMQRYQTVAPHKNFGK